MDTIYALASARGKAGVAVVRVSGPRAWVAGEALAGLLPETGRMALRRIHSATAGDLDRALVVRFEAGHSFTGEKVVEFHLHGSTSVVSAVLLALGNIDDLRMAEAGEFTRRALENGRLDIAQVEGLGDLIEAETEAQRLQALRILDGEMARKVSIWRQDLVRATALLEATIDFADEDIPVNVVPEVIDLIDKTSESLARESQGSHVSERIRDGFEVAIIGAPNIGKSTLLNRLSGREAAITSEIAGTTRDVIEVRMDLDGLPVTLLDTAGIRETNDTIESLGVERARTRAKKADLRVFLTADLGSLPAEPIRQKDDLVVLGKCDLYSSDKGLCVSGTTGEGVSLLVETISKRLRFRAMGAAIATNARHRSAIDKTTSLLKSAKETVQCGSENVELASADLQLAVSALQSLIGTVGVENLLDEIFSSFCIGK